LAAELPGREVSRFSRPAAAIDSAGIGSEVMGRAEARRRLKIPVLSLDRPLRAGEVISPIVRAAVAGAPEIAPRTAARSQPPVRAGYQHRHARRHRRTRRQCAARHPRRSISLPSVDTLTRSFASHAIIGVKSFSTASVQFSPRDTRDRYLACRHSDAEALRPPSARARRPACRRAHGCRRYAPETADRPVNLNIE